MSTNNSLNINTTNPLSPATGGTGVNNSASTLTMGGSVTFSGANPVTFTTTGATNITFPTSGTITSNTNSIIWATNAGTSITAAVGNGYVLTAGTATVVTLPTTFAAGSLIAVKGQGAAWTINLGAATNVQAFGNTYSTSLASASPTDEVWLVATVANTTWGFVSIVSQGLTVL